MAMYIPQDVLEEILSRLPVDSIIRFKCVCKSWYSLFKNPNFAAKHLSNQSVDHIFIKREEEEEDDRRLDFCYLSNDIDDNYAHFAVNADLPFINDGHQLLLIGHCDGLIAYSDGQENVRIVNPATRELRTLPHSSFHPTSFQIPIGYQDLTRYVYPMSFTNLVAMGFGYDSNTNDYKVVGVFQYIDSNTDPGFEGHRAEVFSIRNDSSWRPIKYSMDDTIRFKGIEFQHVYYNGIYYWLGTKDEMDSSEAVLISFNMGDEEFQKVSLPDDCLYVFEDYSDFAIGVEVYNNEFIAVYTFYPGGAWMDVWVMKEFGVKESWTKVLTIGTVPVTMRRLVTFWKNDKELLLQDEEGNLCSFDLVTKIYKCHGLGTIDVWDNWECWSAVPYMKSIVSVNTKVEGIVKDY